MNTQLHVGARKGLFLIERSAGKWRIVRTSHLGVPVPMLLADARDGTLFAPFAGNDCGFFRLSYTSLSSCPVFES